jgi:membrane protease YdiL (CAAX protease family)
MGFGTIKHWFIYGAILIAFYLLLFGLNVLFVPGIWGKPAVMFPNEAQAGWPPALLWGIAVMNAILIGPFSGLVVTFGEEYGWRGYLQGELEKLGRIKGVGLLGVIWGLWHAPVILMGYNYPGEPFWGVVMMTMFCVFMSYFLAYAMYKSGGLWTAVYLHALNNGTASLLLGFAFVTNSSLFSFSLSLYALIPMGLVVLGILVDKVWQK